MKASLPAISAVSMFILLTCSTTVNGQNSNEKAKVKMNNMTYPVKHISVSISKSAAEVYAFASKPENFPKWVAFVKSITRQGDSWSAETTIGTIKIKFSQPNDYGVIDHQVTLTNGEIVTNPMRVLANNKGCEFIFTLFRMPGKTDEEFSEDAKAVTGDLQRLKEILERK